MKKVVQPEHAAGQRADRRALAEINDFIDDGAYDSASVVAWEVQRATPGDPAIWLLLARIDYLRERFAAAMYAARMATRLDPALSDAWLALAMTAVTRPRWQTEGLDAALQATALAPADVRTWTVLSQLQLVSGATYEAAVAAEQAIRIDATDRGGHLMLGETALDAGELVHAEAAFRRVLEMDPTDPDGRMGLVETLESRGADPAAELARYGAPVAPAARSRLVDTTRAGVTSALDRLPPGERGVAIVVVGVCLVLGLLVGLVFPGLGVVRALVGAVALGLMWFAVRPLRTSSPGADQVADSDAAGTDDAANAEAEAGRVAAAVIGDASLARELAADVAAHDAAHGPGSVPTVPANRRPPELQDGMVPAAADAQGAAADAAAVADPPEPEDDVAAAFEMPDDPEELAELSRSRLAVSDLELAHAAASRLEAVAPDALETHRALGAVALAEQDYGQARAHYRRVLELEPLDQEAHERLALASASAERVGSRFNMRIFRNMR